MTILDTNVLVRYFTEDIPSQAARMQALLDSKEPLFIPEAVFSELDFVLRKTYQVDRKGRKEVYRQLLGIPTIQITQEVRYAMRIFMERGKLSLTDCLVLVYGEGNTVASFDIDLLKNVSTPRW